MKAIVIAGVGGPEVLQVRELPTPEPRGDQVRVRVHASGLNRADLLQTRGLYPAPAGVPADIPGMEFAGEIDALGPDVTGRLKVGDRVFGIVGGGSQAEYLVTQERMAVPIPASLDMEQAAAVPEVFVTAHDALITRGRLFPGQRVLIHAVGSGVGTAASQIAHAMGCTVFGTSRTADKLERSKPLGLDVGIDTSHEDFAEVIRDKTGGEGVHVVLDLLGGKVLAGNLKALATRGSLVLVGLLAGREAPLDLQAMLTKRLTIVGTTLRSRPLEEKIAATRLFADQVVPWLAEGKVRPIVDAVFPADRVKEAHERMASNGSFGKVILTF
ncbi:NAD(P)H-quinone oxidoreductase [Aquisphaera insulae]|uniref:NAD(P)H-quinone oxidoreductase n=1 Tax=Aquisphaera insulae TaxID=2712864 RepID=UPI0013EDD4E4|nr:NAD(P)H-quinone oxidoreductase [Aquisphaera insulae]